MDAVHEAALNIIFEHRAYLYDFAYQQWEVPLEYRSYADTTLDEIERLIRANPNIPPLEVIYSFYVRIQDYISRRATDAFGVALETVDDVISLFM